jgi:long-chain acyl-CoA synthetase
MLSNEQMLDHTIPQLLRRRMEEDPDRVALREKDFGIWRTWTWREYYDLVSKTAAGLDTLGFTRGEVLALITDNIPEMLVMAIGAHAVGGISAGIYQTSMPHEIAEILDYMGATVVFCCDQEQVDKLIDVRDKIPKVKKVVYEDPRGMRDYGVDDWFLPITELYELGAEALAKNPSLVDDAVALGKPDDVCHLCLTSGTTGRPKGACMIHRNYINMGLRLTEVDPLEESDEYVSFLPFAWIGEQMNSFGVALTRGITINFPESVETMMADLKEVGPHMMFGAPRIYETIRSNIWLKIDESYWLNRKVYGYFMDVGEKAAQYKMHGKPMPLGLKVKSWIGQKLVLDPLINQIGLYRLRRAYTGGAALGPELFTFYQAIGVNLKQIYGQTEITGIAYVHRDGDVRSDTVGEPLPGTECMISEAGEIMSKSASVCAGYFQMPEETEALVTDGWLHSGDAGYIDENGHLIVIDRLSDVMHNNQDEMFSPMFLENKLKFSPYIKEAVIFGNKQDYVAALINIDPVIVGKWAEDRGISFTTFMDLSQQPKVAELIRAEVVKINNNVEKDYFRIHRFGILYKLLDVDDGELTKTGKIRREFVQQRYQELYEALYDESVTEKHVQAVFQYQDGQSTTVEADMTFYTLD